MANLNKATHEVVHPKLNMRVGKKMKRLKVGDKLTLTDEQAESLGKKVKPLKDGETIDVTPDAKKGKGK